MKEGQVIELLSQLPDGIFISNGRIAKIENGEVTELVEVTPEIQKIIGGTQDPKAFAAMLDSAIQVEQGNWYGKGKGMI